MMIQDFSNGYYRASMNVLEYEDGPVIERGLYDFIDRELYDSPISVMVRLGMSESTRFAVSAERSIPREVIGIPSELVTHEGVQNVFFLKEEHAEIVGKYYG